LTLTVNEVTMRLSRGISFGLGSAKYLPGIFLLFIVGYLGKIVANYVPHTEYVLFAIAIGMVLRNTINIPQIFVPGINTYEFWLKTGIVLMGSRLALQNIISIGATGLVLVVVVIFLSLLTATCFGRLFGISERLGTLIGVGVGICGVSAIIGATGAIGAKEEDSSYAIATIMVFGAIMVFLFPLLGHMWGLSDEFFGLWTGLSLDNTAAAVATGFAYSEAAGNLATVVKLSRNALMGVVILLVALLYARKGLRGKVENKAAFLWSRFPKFLLGFLAFSLFATLGVFDPGQVKALDNLSKWFFLLTFAGVGLSTEFSRMKAGLKPFFVGLGVETVVAAVSYVMIYFALGM
jgi:uncharacterized integral membrane protein (TIGR00698 family)